MTSVNLHLSEDLQEFVNAQVDVEQFDGPGEYIEALISRAKKGKDRLETLLIDGLDSGDPIPLDADDWSRIRVEVKERLTNGQ